MFGYNGKLAFIDLNDASVKDYPISQEDYALYLGGKTLAAKIIFDSFDRKIEAFSDENLIVITTSPLTGSTAHRAADLLKLWWQFRAASEKIRL